MKNVAFDVICSMARGRSIPMYYYNNAVNVKFVVERCSSKLVMSFNNVLVFEWLFFCQGGSKIARKEFERHNATEVFLASISNGWMGLDALGALTRLTSFGLKIWMYSLDLFRTV